MELDVQIRGGTVYDGFSPAGTVADIGIAGGKIVSVTPSPAPAGTPTRNATRVIDAAGKAVMPGFIDIHTHSELALLVWPNGTSKLLAGVTTDVSGNCGSSPFPLSDEAKLRREDDWAKYDLEVDWDSPAGYFERVEASPCGVNRAVLVGHGNLRAVVLGYDNVPAGPADIDRMKSLLAEGLQAGAFGMSTGLIYPPGMWGNVDEIAALAEVVAEHDGYYTSHIRDERFELLESIDEFIEVISRSRCRGLVSHLKAADKIEPLRERFERARDRGLQLFADCYPYTASCTSLAAMVLPKWAVEGKASDRLARLHDGDARGRIVQEVGARGGEFFDSVRVIDFAKSDLLHLAGKSLTEVGQLLNMPPVEAAIYLLIEDKLQTEAIHFVMTEEEKRAIFSWPFVMVGSDYSARDALVPGEMVHPRAFGTSAAFLGKYVRDMGVCDWPMAARKLASMQADMLGLSDRGRLAPGCWADVVVFDPQTIADRATYTMPRQTPTGVEHVLVNGVVAVANGEFTGALAGHVLRRQ